VLIESIIRKASLKEKQFWVLIDPDKQEIEEATAFALMCEKHNVDVLLVGTSLMMTDRFIDTVRAIKNVVKIPVIIFPAGSQQVTPYADGILFISLISGRNPQYLIGEHVQSAPMIKASGIEPLSTAYMLIESGSMTAVNFVSNTMPIPRKKIDIAVAHALAAEYLGMKLIYLEGGSGADMSVPSEMVSAVKHTVTIPVIVGGGVDDPQTAAEKAKAGADIIVVGTALENNRSEELLRDFRNAVR